MNSNQKLVSLFSAIDRSVYGENLNYYSTSRLAQTVPLSFDNSVSNARLFYIYFVQRQTILQLVKGESPGGKG